MKKAIEYLCKVNSFITREELYNIGKQMQQDAIEETLKLAAEEVQLKEYNKTPQDCYSISNDMGDIWGIDKQSILNLKEQLFKELEDETM